MCNARLQGRNLGLRCRPRTRSAGALTGAPPPLGMPADVPCSAAALEACAGCAPGLLWLSLA